jgi:hypothetical protein
MHPIVPSPFRQIPQQTASATSEIVFAKNDVAELERAFKSTMTITVKGTTQGKLNSLQKCVPEVLSTAWLEVLQ